MSWELFFADDLVIIATYLEEYIECIKAWKECLKPKGFHVNMRKTMFMVSGSKPDVLCDSGKHPGSVQCVDWKFVHPVFYMQILGPHVIHNSKEEREEKEAY